MTRRACASLLIALLLLWTSSAGAATALQYTLPGAGVTFGDSGAIVLMVFSNKATGSGTVSAQYDKQPLASPTGAMPSLWAAHCQVSFAGTPTLGVTGAEYYIAHADAAGTTQDGAVGQTSTTITSDQRRVLTFIGTLPVYNNTANTTLYVSFRNIYIPGRFFSVAWFNTSGITSETSTTKHKCTFYPMPIQMQSN
jgi:hypothetical protein